MPLYAMIINHFVPVCVETTGVLGKHATEF